MTADDELKCKDPACSCPVGDNEEYCCLECQQNKEPTDCPCIHEVCDYDEQYAEVR
jgi:hypothetical protein